MIKKLSILLIPLLMISSLSACSTPKVEGPISMDKVYMKSDSIAVIETVLGDIEIQLFTAEIPELSKNFIELTKEGKYDGAPFHRVIPGFMIQGGDFENKNGTGGYSYKGPGTQLPGEYDATVSSNLRGTLSMANSGPDTNGSQFFINLVDNSNLDHDKEPLSSQHPVFAKVIEGMDVVDAIAKIKLQ